MYSIDELIEQVDVASDDDLENIIEEDNSNNQEEAVDADTENKDDAEAESEKVDKKPRNPTNRPKLDAERLKGPRGLPGMERIFSKIEFKGNGHEREDLDAVMNSMQYWCHRLFPKYSFNDCLAHLERLGAKKPVMVLKRKILFDIFEEDQPIVDDAENDEVNNEPQQPINEFDLLLAQDPIPTLTQPSVPPARIELTDEQKEMIERNRLLAAERRRARLEVLQEKQTENNDQDSKISKETSNSTIDSQLTEDQKQIIERNRLLAFEKRRLKQNLEASFTTSAGPSSQNSELTMGETENVQSEEFSQNSDSDSECYSRIITIEAVIEPIKSQEKHLQCSTNINLTENSISYTEKMDVDIVIPESENELTSKFSERN